MFTSSTKMFFTSLYKLFFIITITTNIFKSTLTSTILNYSWHPPFTSSFYKLVTVRTVAMKFSKMLYTFQTIDYFFYQKIVILRFHYVVWQNKEILYFGQIRKIEWNTSLQIFTILLLLFSVLKSNPLHLHKGQRKARKFALLSS